MLNEKKLYARSCMNESPLQSYIGCIADACKGGFWVAFCVLDSLHLLVLRSSILSLSLESSNRRSSSSIFQI
ncbi:hypothetical protein AAC387_Pa07g3203 [Persea americana]